MWMRSHFREKGRDARGGSRRERVEWQRTMRRGSAQAHLFHQCFLCLMTQCFCSRPLKPVGARDEKGTETRRAVRRPHVSNTFRARRQCLHGHHLEHVLELSICVYISPHRRVALLAPTAAEPPPSSSEFGCWSARARIPLGTGSCFLEPRRQNGGLSPRDVRQCNPRSLWKGRRSTLGHRRRLPQPEGPSRDRRNNTPARHACARQARLCRIV